MNDDFTSTFWPLIRILRGMRGGLTVLRGWWSGRAFRYQRELIDIDPITPVSLLFDQEINGLIWQSGQGSGGTTPPVPPLSEKDLKWLPNSAVRDSLRASHLLASSNKKEIIAGLVQLDRALDNTSALRSQLETQLGPGGKSVQRPGRPRHLINYYGTVHGLLQVRRARALARLIPAQTDETDEAVRAAQEAFRAAQREQPGMLYIAKEHARYLGSRCRFDEVDEVLSGVRSGLTAAGRYELARVRVELTRDFIEPARSKQRLRPLLKRIMQDRVELRRCSDELDFPAGSDDARDLLGWRALAAAHQGNIHTELGELELAVTAYLDSLDLYSEKSDDLASELYLTELIGNLHVRQGSLGLARSYYARALARWRNAGKPAERIADAKRVAGRLATAAMMADDVPLPDLMSAEFTSDDHGPAQTLADLPNPFFGLPEAPERLRLALDARLRREADARAVRDILYALRALMGGTPATGGFLAPEEDYKRIENWAVVVRLELDTGLLGLFQKRAKLEPVLLERTTRARLSVQEDWGVRLRGFQVADGPKWREYRILIRGRIARDGKVPFTALFKEVPWRLTAGRWPKGAVAPAAEVVFQALEECLRQNMPRLISHNELWWTLGQYELIPATGPASAEVVNARSMVPSLDIIRRLLSRRVKLPGPFPAMFARIQRGLGMGESSEDIVSAIRRAPEVVALADVAPQPPQLPGATLDQAAPGGVNGPPVSGIDRLDREANRRGLDDAARLKVREKAGAAAGRQEDSDYATELALDQFGASTIILRASAMSYLRVENWTAKKQTDRLREEVYRGTGLWLPAFDLQRGDELDAETCQVGFNEWHAPIKVSTSLDAFYQAILQALDGRLAAFMSNRQLELLLHRLGSDNQLLVSNLLERFRVPIILDELRRLLDARRSIRNLLDFAEILLLREFRPQAERWALLDQAMPAFHSPTQPLEDMPRAAFTSGCATRGLRPNQRPET